jgi:hypothetical protein
MNSTINTTMIPTTTKKAPRFLYKWRMNTVKEQKDAYVWSSPKLSQLEMVSADIYAAAKSYAIVSAKGLLRRIAVEAEQEADPSGETQIARQSMGEVDDNVPF